MATRSKKTTSSKPRRKSAAKASTKAVNGSSGKYQTISLSEDQKLALRDLDRQLANEKVRLANQAMEASELRKRLRGLKGDMDERVVDIEKMSKQFVEVVKMMAQSHGINVEESSDAPWRLKLDSMEFTNEPDETPGFH